MNVHFFFIYINVCSKMLLIYAREYTSRFENRCFLFTHLGENDSEEHKGNCSIIYFQISLEIFIFFGFGESHGLLSEGKMEHHIFILMKGNDNSRYHLKDGYFREMGMYEKFIVNRYNHINSIFRIQERVIFNRFIYAKYQYKLDFGKLLFGYLAL